MMREQNKVNVFERLQLACQNCLNAKSNGIQIFGAFVWEVCEIGIENLSPWAKQKDSTADHSYPSSTEV